MKPDLTAGAQAYLAGFGRLLERVEVTARGGEVLSLDHGIIATINLIVSVRDRGGKALLIGNGGSAAIASHLHNDLCKSVRMRAIAFNEPPLLTALANDDGYDNVFSYPVGLWADDGDLLIAVSSSGESANILKAGDAARMKGCRLLTFTGFQPTNRLRQAGDLNIYVPSPDYGYVEMAHSIVAHYVTDVARMRVAASV